MNTVPGTQARPGQLKGAPLKYTPALSANIRLGRKSLLETNTLSYYENLLITEEKKFYNIGPWSIILYPKATMVKMLLFEQDKHLMLFTGAFGSDKIGTFDKNGKLQ